MAGFGALGGSLPGPFDAITCIGNSLPHLPDDALAACCADFAALLHPGGLLVIQNRNYDRLLRERQRFMPLASRVDEEGETLFLRISDFRSPGDPAGELIDFTIVTLKKRDGAWTQTVQTTPLRPLRRATVEKALAAAGFSSMSFYGGYGMSAADSPDATDLVVVARR